MKPIPPGSRPDSRHPAPSDRSQKNNQDSSQGTDHHHSNPGSLPGEYADSTREGPLIREFKPCPFCGRIWMSVRRQGDLHYVQCLCGAGGPVESRRDAAIRAWNLRDRHLLWNPFRLTMRFPDKAESVDIRGRLEAMDLATVLQMLNAREKTGILQLSREHMKSAICLYDGNIIAASDSSGQRLGQMLVNTGILSRERLKTALETAKNSSKLLGETLLLLQFIDETTLRDAVRQQVQEAVLELFFWKDGAFEYCDCEVEFDRRSMAEINTVEIIMESARRMDEWKELRDRKKELEMRKVRIRPKAAARPSTPFRLKANKVKAPKPGRSGR